MQIFKILSSTINDRDFIFCRLKDHIKTYLNKLVSALSLANRLAGNHFFSKLQTFIFL